MQPGELEQDDDGLIQTVLSELGSILRISAPPEIAVVSRYPQGMPQYHVGHLERVSNIEACAGRLSHLKLAGNYFRGVGIPDCIQSGEQAADVLTGELLAKGGRAT